VSEHPGMKMDVSTKRLCVCVVLKSGGCPGIWYSAHHFFLFCFFAVILSPVYTKCSVIVRTLYKALI